MARYLTKKEIKDIINLQNALSNAHYCDISGGDLLHIQDYTTFEDEYDLNEEDLENFLSETPIDDIDGVGISVGYVGAEEYGETEFYSLIDFVTGYYDLNLYKLQNVEWR